MMEGLPEMPEKQLLLKNNVEIRATKGGIFYPKIKIGNIVNKNDIIGYIRRINGEKIYLKAKESGIIIGIRTLSTVRQGEAIAWLLSFKDAEVLTINKKVKKRKSSIIEKAMKFIK